MIVGQVVDATTGAPLPDAIVRLTMPKYFNNPAAPSGRVIADEDGRFVFAGLPSGDYYLEASVPGYVSGELGQRSAGGQSQILSLAQDERRDDVVLRVWKYAVIGGSVVDEAGEPVVGVAVRALAKNVVAGRVQYGNADFTPELVPAAITDDRGMFRLSQLVPATYVVVVPATQTTLPAAYLTADDATLRTNLFFSGVNDVTLLGNPNTQQFGDAALMTSNRVLIPPAPSPAGRLAVYRTTFYPAATTAAAAAPIALRAGEERTDLSIALRPEPAVRISGQLVSPDGTTPPPTTIRLIGEARKDVITAQVPTGPDDVGFQTVSGISDSAGRFTLLGVPPGEYVLEHATRSLARATPEGGPSYWISQPLTVGTEDLADVRVMLRPVIRIEGRIEFRSTRGGTSRPFIPGVTFETPLGEAGQFAVQATRTATPTFSTVAAGRSYIVRPYEVDGWVVQSVIAGGTDITDRAFTPQSATSIVITMTDALTPVSGLVRDAHGAASPTAIVLAFPVDRARWSGYGMSPRDLRSTLTTAAGAYKFDHLPAGDYYLIALEAADAEHWMDPARLEAFTAQATRLAIAAGDTSKTIDLRLQVVR